MLFFGLSAVLATQCCSWNLVRSWTLLLFLDLGAIPGPKCCYLTLVLFFDLSAALRPLFVILLVLFLDYSAVHGP